MNRLSWYEPRHFGLRTRERHEKGFIQIGNSSLSMRYIHNEITATVEILSPSHHSDCGESVFVPCHNNTVPSHPSLCRRYRERPIASIAQSAGKDLVRKQWRVVLNKWKLLRCVFLFFGNIGDLPTDSGVKRDVCHRFSRTVYLYPELKFGRTGTQSETKRKISIS